MHTAKILSKYTTKSFAVPDNCTTARIFQKCHTVLHHASLHSLLLLIISSDMNSLLYFHSLFSFVYSLISQCQMTILAPYAPPYHFHIIFSNKQFHILSHLDTGVLGKFPVNIDAAI